MIKIIAIVFFVFMLLNSCSPKSYCFFNTRERLLYISDKKGDSIKSVTINSEDPSFNFRTTVNINPAATSVRFDADSITNHRAYLLITTNNQIWYALKLKEEDWSKDMVIKCRHLIK